MRRILALVLVLTMAACSRTSGQPVAPAVYANHQVWFVERHPRDGRDLATTIAEALRARGVNAASGSEFQRPDSFDVLVTYEDRWHWDMRMYLLDLRIDVRDPKTLAVLAYGQSYQDSVAAMGKTHRDIVNRALNQIFAASP